jgi:hypothetical protein
LPIYTCAVLSERLLLCITMCECNSMFFTQNLSLAPKDGNIRFKLLTSKSDTTSGMTFPS